MKVFALLIASLVIKYPCESVDVSLSIAFENVTRHLFKLETRMFIDNYNVDMDELASLILKGLNERAMPFQLSNKKLDNEVQMDSSALVIFDSIEKLREFNGKLNLTNKYYKPLQLFLYCQDASYKDIESLTTDVARRHKNTKRPFRMKLLGIQHSSRNFIVDEKNELTDVINYEYFLVRQSEFIKLLTFVWYSSVKCGRLQLIEVNKFNLKTSKWENENFSIEKLENFHGCEIVQFILGWEIDMDSYMMHATLATNLNYKLKTMRSQHLGSKFKVDFYHLKACYDAQDYMNVFDNIIEPTNKKNRTRIDYFITWPINYPQSWLAVPTSGNYSEYEKLVMPFDVYTWSLIAFTFVVAFASILILYCVSGIKRDFVIGSNVRTPSLNILQIFFGIGMIALPRRNFARFLTISFILYCLIIRTAWQGKMFEFMTKDIPKPEIQTIEEMIEGGYDFYMDPNFKEMYPESEIAKRGKVKSSDESLDMYMDSGYLKLFDPNFKGVYAINQYFAFGFLKLTKGRFAKRIREELLSTTMCGLAFMRHHHFTGIFDLKSQQLFTAGISHAYDGGNYNFRIQWMNFKKKYKLPPDEPKVLNLAKLEPGFAIFGLCLIFTLLVFLLELVSEYVLLSHARNVKVASSVVPKIEDSVIKVGHIMDWENEQKTSEDVVGTGINIEANEGSENLRDSVDGLTEDSELVRIESTESNRVEDSTDEAIAELLEV